MGGELQEVRGDVWKAHARGAWVCVLTNCSVNARSEAVMGAGIAKEAKERFPELPKMLGALIDKGGEGWHAFPELKLIAFPTKYDFALKSNVWLIRKSWEKLVEYAEARPTERFFLPRPGTGAGRLAWGDVKPILKNCPPNVWVARLG